MTSKFQSEIYVKYFDFSHYFVYLPVKNFILLHQNKSQSIDESQIGRRKQT